MLIFIFLSYCINTKAQSVIQFNVVNRSIRPEVYYSKLLPANKTWKRETIVFASYPVSLDIDYPQLVTIVVDSTLAFRAYVIPDGLIGINIGVMNLSIQGRNPDMDNVVTFAPGGVKTINDYYQEKLKKLGYQTVTERTFQLDPALSAFEALNLINQYQAQDTALLQLYADRLPGWFLGKERELSAIYAQTAKYRYATAHTIPYEELVDTDSSLSHPYLHLKDSLNLRDPAYYNLLCLAYFKKIAHNNDESYPTRFRKVREALLADGLGPLALENLSAYWLSLMLPYVAKEDDLNEYQELWNELRTGFTDRSSVELIDEMLTERTRALRAG